MQFLKKSINIFSEYFKNNDLGPKNVPFAPFFVYNENFLLMPVFR